MASAQLPTYTAAKPVSADFKTPKQMEGFTGAGYAKAAEIYGSAMKSMSTAAGVIGEIAEIEANDNAKRRGQIKAQEDFAIIQQLEDYKTESLMKYNEYKESLGDFEAIKNEYQQNPNDETIQAIMNKARLFEDDIAKVDNRIKGYLEPGSAFRVAEKTRAAQLTEMYLDNVMIDAKGTLVELSKSFENDPIAFESQANQLLDQLDSVPPEYRESIKYNIKNEIKIFKDRAADNLLEQQKQQTFARRNQKIQLLETEISQLARDGREITEKYNTVRNTLEEQVIDGLITPNDMYNKLAVLEKDIETQKVVGVSDKILKGTGTIPQKVKQIKAFAEEFNNKINPHLHEDEKQVIYNRMLNTADKLETQYEAERKKQFEVQTEYVKDIIKRVNSGGKVDMADLKYAQNVVTQYGDPTLARTFYSAMQVKETLDDFQAMPPAAQQMRLDKLNQRIEEKAARGESTLQDRMNYDVLAGQYEKNMKNVEKDPISYLSENPLVIQGSEYKPTKITTFDSSIKKDEKGNLLYNQYIQDVTSELGSRFGKNKEITAYVGDFKILADGEANVLNRRYQHMDKDSQAKFLNELTKQVGYEKAQGIINDMWKDKADSSLMAAQLYASNNKNEKTLADDMMRGRDIRLSGASKMDSDARNALKDIVNSKLMLAGSGIKPSNLTIIQQSIEDAYLGRAVQGEGFDPSLVDEIFEDVTYGTTTFNGKIVFNPEKGKDVDDLVDWIEKISGEGNTFLSETAGLPDGYKSMEEFKQDLAPKGLLFKSSKFQLESVGKGAYAIRTKTGNYLKKDGKPYIINWYLPNPVDPKGAKIPWYSDDIGYAKDVDMADSVIKKYKDHMYEKNEPDEKSGGGIRG